MAQAIRFYILTKEESYSIYKATNHTFSYLEGLRRNPFRTSRGTQVLQINTADRRVFRHHFVFSTSPLLDSIPPNILIPEFFQVVIGTSSGIADSSIESHAIYTLVQFPEEEVFHLDLFPAAAA